MPVSSDIPTSLKPYLSHGLELKIGRTEALGECPWCAAPKFYINVETGLWSCRKCGLGNDKGGGNSTLFLRMLWETALKTVTESDYERLAEDRGLMHAETLREWGVGVSHLSGEVVVPGFNAEGKLIQLYRYVAGPSGKRILLATPGLNHGLHYADVDPKKGAVYICEGPWDGMALEELMRVSRMTSSKLVPTGTSDNLLVGASVIAVPGCNVFYEHWLPLLREKRVILLFDSDHPRSKDDGVVSPPAGTEGMKRVAGLMCRSEEPPSEVCYLHWGDNGYDPSKPSGYDVRDLVQEGGDSLSGKVKRLEYLLGLIKPVPPSWTPGGSSKAGSVSIEPRECSDWKTLKASFYKAVKVTKGLEGGLAFSLAVVVSTKQVGDQLWGILLSPPSTGKTTIADGVGVSRKYVVQRDTITSLFSGYQTDKEGTEDISLVNKMRNRTLIIKDLDTLLKHPNRSIIMAQLRALYDRSVRTNFGNKMSRDYEGMCCTALFCGTPPARKEIDDSSLGDRFLDYCIMDSIDDDLEDAILERKSLAAYRNIAIEADGRADTVYDPIMVDFMKLCGGYVDHLRRNSTELLESVKLRDDVRREIHSYAKFVSYMRARPPRKHSVLHDPEHQGTRELGARLVSQLVRLAVSVSAVWNRYSVEDEALAMVRKVTKDTSKGRSVEYCETLYRVGDTGIGSTALAQLLLKTSAATADYLRFLNNIGVAETHRVSPGPYMKAETRWRLTYKMKRLWGEVMGDE